MPNPYTEGTLDWYRYEYNQMHTQIIKLELQCEMLEASTRMWRNMYYKTKITKPDEKETSPNN